MKTRNHKIRKIGLYDLGRLPLSPPVIKEPNFRTWKELQAESAAEQKATEARIKAEAEEKLAAPLRAAEQELKVAAGEHAYRIRTFYSKPLQVISDAGIDVAPVDMVGDYPERVGSRDTKKEFEIYQEFREGLTTRGCELSEAGWARLGSYISVLAEHRGIEVTPIVWQQALERLHSLGVFQEKEILRPTGNRPGQIPRVSTSTKVKQELPAQPQPEPTFDEILERTSTESKVDRPVILRALNKEHDKEAYSMFREWVHHLENTFPGFTISHEDATYILEEMFPKHNWSYLRGENYNLARRAMVAQLKWPSSMLTPVERIAKELEDIPSTDYFRYRDIKQRLRNAEDDERAERAKSRT